MGSFFKIIYESVLQATQQLFGNPLRSFLSLMGICIGIFCIIGVQSAVDSLEDNVRDSFDKLGDDVVYVQKITWMDVSGNWMKYLRRPNINYEDFEKVTKKVKSAEMTSYSVFLGNKTLKYLSNSVEGIELEGLSYDFGEMFKFQFYKGRYFSPSEYQYGVNKVILGYTAAEELFGNIEPIGKKIKMGGRKLEVIGVLEKSGESLVNIFNYDEAAIISYELARKIANLKPDSPWGNSSINVKAKENVPIDQLKGELTGVLRAQRRLKPKEEDNFSLNTLSIVSNALNGFFSTLNLVGLVIGVFAIFVGIFSVANIMFVSVKERTRLIGIKKALGAKRYVIMVEFLIESIILCLIGGVVGLLFAAVILGLISSAIEFDMYLSLNNIAIGIGLAAVVGVIAGAIPAYQAASMDPVVAMRK